MAAPTSPPTPPAADVAGAASGEVLPKMPSTGGWWIGGILLFVGIVGGVVMTGVGFGRLINLTVGQKVSVPSTRTLNLEPGPYKVTVDDYYTSYSINPRVFVKSPDGREQEITTNVDPYHSYSYSASKTLGQFDASTPGSYVLRTELRDDIDVVDDPFAPSTTARRNTTTTRRSGTASPYSRYSYPNTVSVTHSDSEIASQTVPLILGGILGGLVFTIAGAVVLIVTGTRRGRAKRARAPKRPPAYANFPPPVYTGMGVYPPPPPSPYPGGPPPGPFGPPPGPGAFGPPPGAAYGPPPGPYGPIGAPPGPYGPPPGPYGGYPPRPNFPPPQGQPVPPPPDPGRTSSPRPSEAPPGASSGPWSDDDEPYGKPPFPDPTRRDPFD